MLTKICRCFLAAILVAAPLFSSVASAGMLYNPVVTVVGDGTVAASGVGYTTSIYLYDNTVASQAAPISSASYNSGATGTRLVNSGMATSEGSLTNNPGVADAAAQGIAYTGTAYAYSAGYNAADNTASVSSAATNASRAIGDVTLSANSVSNPMVLQTQAQASAYAANNIRGATGDDSGTGASLYSAGTGSPSTTAGWRNFDSNTQLPSGTLTNTRTVELLGGHLFGSTGSGSTVGIYLLDPTGVNPATPFITTGTSSTNSPYEFALFNNPANQSSIDGYNVAYIADDGASGAGPAASRSGSITAPRGPKRHPGDSQLAAGVDYRGLAGKSPHDRKCHVVCQHERRAEAAAGHRYRRRVDVHHAGDGADQ